MQKKKFSGYEFVPSGYEFVPNGYEFVTGYEFVDVKLSLTVDGGARLDISWYRNGKTIQQTENVGR